MDAHSFLACLDAHCTRDQCQTFRALADNLDTTVPPEHAPAVYPALAALGTLFAANWLEHGLAESMRTATEDMVRWAVIAIAEMQKNAESDAFILAGPVSLLFSIACDCKLQETQAAFVAFASRAFREHPVPDPFVFERNATRQTRGILLFAALSGLPYKKTLDSYLH